MTLRAWATSMKPFLQTPCVRNWVPYTRAIQRSTKKKKKKFPPSNHTANILKTHLSLLLPAPQYLPEGLMGQACPCSQRGHGWGTQNPSQATNTNELKLGLWNSFPRVPPHRGMGRNSLTLINYEGLWKHAECPNAVSMKFLPTQMKPRTT